MKKQVVKIPELVNSLTFLRMADYYARRFKSTLGYGRWLVEYQEMDKQGVFEAPALRDMYKAILQRTFKGSFIVLDAIYNICTQAFEASKAISENSLYEIRCITGEVATDENDMPIKDISFDEAVKICKAMNEEAEEHLFDIYLFNKKVNLYED